MASWLTKAAAAFGRKTEAPPEPFDIPCDCGGHLTGLRTGSYQKLRCLGCERTVLVLPTSPYPAVKRSFAALKPSRTAVHPDESPGRKAARRAKKRRPSAETKKHAETRNETVPPVVEERLDLSPALQQARGRRRTLRLVVAAMAALVLFTAWGLWDRSVRERARLQIPVATEAGVAALRGGDFAKAARELTTAVRGLDRLGRTDAAAQSIRQAQREAVAAAGLASSDLVEIAEEFLSDAGSPEEKQRRFQMQWGGQWLIFDADLAPARAAGVTGFELDVPWLIGERSLQVACDFPELKRAIEEGRERRAIFAGQIEGWIVPEQPAQPVVARIKSSSAILWSDYDSYVALGYRPESADAEKATRDLLKWQLDVALSRTLGEAAP